MEEDGRAEKFSRGKRLPEICGAFERGEVSYSKVRAMTRIARPDNERDLLAVAKAGTAAHVEKLVRCYRRADPEAERERARRHEEGRFLETWTDEDGMLVIRGRLPPEVGAALKKAIDAATDALFAEERAAKEDVTAETSARSKDVTAETSTRSEDVTAETSAPSKRLLGGPPRPRPTQRRVDALGLVARAALGGGLEGAGRDRAQVVVHVDAEVLRDEERDGCCELGGGPNVPVETARRLSCDGDLVRMTVDAEGNPLDVGRKTRALTTAIARALDSRDKGCRFPGCTHDRYLEAHQVKHWAEGGETKLENLVHLCWFHHRAVHEGGYRVELDMTGDLVVHRPDGRPLRHAPPPIKLTVDPEELLAEEHRALGIEIRPETLTAWRGESMDYDWAVSSLMR